MGTGPYKFVSYKAGVEVKLTRFDDYYRGAARIKDVDYQIITDDNTATVNLRTGDVDAGSFARASYDEVMNEPALTVADWVQTVSTILQSIMKSRRLTTRL